METFKDGILKISVRNLVEFVLRHGDIDNRTFSGTDVNAMQEGARLHRKIQGKMGGDYHAEVPLRMEFPFDDFAIVVEGRADGIIDGDAQDLKRSVFIPIPKKGNAKECSNYRTIALISQMVTAAMKLKDTYSLEGKL